jgi:hypothetical protein
MNAIIYLVGLVVIVMLNSRLLRPSVATGQPPHALANRLPCNGRRW